jgi:hypothetical protein
MMKAIKIELDPEEVAFVMLALGFQMGGVATRQDDPRLGMVADRNLALANKIAKQTMKPQGES